MGRPLRHLQAGVFYHVIARGNNGNPLFLCSADYGDFLKAMARIMDAFAVENHCFTLMTNHLHLLLRPLADGLATAMERLLGWYSKRFNWRHGTGGHVFRDRYLSKPVATLSYLKNLIAYFGNNPVKAGLCRRPEDYAYSSFGSYFGKGTPLVQVEVIRTLFPGAQRELSAFTASRRGIESDEYGWPLGQEWYADMEEALMPELPDRRLDAMEVVRVVAESRAVDPKVLRKAVRDPRLAPLKGLTALALRDSTPFTLAEIASAAGYSSVEGACRAISQARRRTRPEDVQKLLNLVRQSLSG